MEQHVPYFAMFVGVLTMMSLGLGLFLGTRLTAQDKTMGAALFICAIFVGGVSELMIANGIYVACSTLFLSFFMIGYSITVKTEKTSRAKS